MTQNLAKSIIGGVVLSYQANLTIKTPNLTESYINSYVFTCQDWVPAYLNAYLNIGHVVGMYDDWPGYFRFGRTPSKSERVGRNWL